MDIEYKEKTELDFDEVIDIFYQVNFLRHPEKRLDYKTAIEKAFKNSQYVITAWDGEKLVGFARVITDETLFATIWNMVVKPDYQSKGIGKELIQKCLDKFPTCHFFLFADKEVVEFYKKMGFELHEYGMALKDGRKRSLIYN